MADTEHLRSMVDNLVADKPEQAQVDFHQYMRDKVREQLGMQDTAPELPEQD